MRCKAVKDKPPMDDDRPCHLELLFSPTLNRSIAMALIENGRAPHGRNAVLPARRQGGHGEDRRSRFYDKEGARQNV